MPCSKCHSVSYQNEPKLLYLDTENSPRRGYFYGKKYETAIQWMDKDWDFLMFSYAWNDGDVKVVQSWDEKNLVQRMWEIIDKADIIVAHNLAFDLGHFYAKCIKYGLPVPRESKRVCTLKMYRKLCKDGFESNSLKDIAIALGLPPKKELPKGFWREYVEKRSRKLIKEAKEYAGGDIVTLRAVYHAIAPFYPPYKIKIIKRDDISKKRT